jgi:hypothetical protein
VRWVFIIEIWYKLDHERRIMSGSAFRASTPTSDKWRTGFAAAAYVCPIGNTGDAQAALALVDSSYRDRLFALQPHSYLQVAHSEVSEGRNRL